MATIPYYIVQRVDPRDPTQPTIYYAKVRLKKTVSFRDLVRKISSFSTVNPPDVMAVMESLIHIVPELMKEGAIVRMGELGSFYPSIKSQGYKSKEEVSSKGISTTRIRFRPGRLIREEMRGSSFRRQEK